MELEPRGGTGNLNNSKLLETTTQTPATAICRLYSTLLFRSASSPVWYLGLDWSSLSGSSGDVQVALVHSHQQKATSLQKKMAYRFKIFDRLRPILMRESRKLASHIGDNCTHYLDFAATGQNWERGYRLAIDSSFVWRHNHLPRLSIDIRFV